MELKGERRMPGEPAAVYALLTDPEVLVRTMPGLKRLTPAGTDGYEAEMELGVGPVSGRYAGRMRIVPLEPGVAYGLHLTGQGPAGPVEADLTIALAEEAGGTRLTYTGEVAVGGKLAGLAQRVLPGVAGFVLGRFLDAVAAEAQAGPRAGTGKEA